jgi:hypothetical protein
MGFGLCCTTDEMTNDGMSLTSQGGMTMFLNLSAAYRNGILSVFGVK